MFGAESDVKWIICTQSRANPRTATNVDAIKQGRIMKRFGAPSRFVEIKPNADRASKRAGIDSITRTELRLPCTITRIAMPSDSAAMLARIPIRINKPCCLTVE